MAAAGLAVNKQDGNNCRFIAIGNILRDKVPPLSEILDAQMDLIREHLPDQLAVYNMMSGINWTLSTDSSESVMTKIFDARLPQHIAVNMIKELWQNREKRWGVNLFDLCTTGKDEDTLGLAYYNDGHCMSAVCDDGMWFQVEQSTPVQVNRSTIVARSRVQKGVVFVFSTIAAHTLLDSIQKCVHAEVSALLEAVVSKKEGDEKEEAGYVGVGDAGGADEKKGEEDDGKGTTEEEMIRKAIEDADAEEMRKALGEEDRIMRSHSDLAVLIRDNCVSKDTIMDALLVLRILRRFGLSTFLDDSYYSSLIADHVLVNSGSELVIKTLASMLHHVAFHPKS